MEIVSGDSGYVEINKFLLTFYHEELGNQRVSEF